jgi:uncharacterized membrane protein YedE/YeeE
MPSASTAPASAHLLLRARKRSVVASIAAILALGLLVAQTQGLRMAALYVVGVALGLTLYHASFGFTAAFRVLMADGRSAGVRAQMAMLAIAVALFFPALALGQVFGQPVGGFVLPAGLSVAIGSFLFGIGMQLGGGCGSGTLFTVGGGSTRMVLTLIFFIIGSLIGVAHLSYWQALPSLPPISIVESLGLAPALALNLAIFGLIWLGARAIELRAHGKLAPIFARSEATLGSVLLRGPWPLLAGAVLLAALNFATLALAGRPWGITAAFALWGAKTLQTLGVDVAQWASWSDDWSRNALASSILTDVTSVMDFGLILGAFAAAAFAGKFKPVLSVPMGQIVASVIGGLLLGYGARISYGCNIGAFFSGVASGSLHGWLWILCALPGNWVGIALRPAFGMPVERTLRAC